MATKLYFHNATNALSGTFPTGEQASWTKDGASGSDTLKTMNRIIGSAVASLSVSTGGSSTVYEFFGFFCSPPLASAQTVGGGSITFNAAERKNNGAASLIIDSLNIYVWRPSTGTLVGTIRQGQDLGGTTPTAVNSTQVTHITGITSSAVSAAAGDVVICEVWTRYTTGSNPNTATFYYDGTTENTTENAVVSNHASYIELAEDLVFEGEGGSFTLSAAHGSVTLSGQSASLLANRVLPAAHGSFAVSGQDAALLRAFRLIAAHGTVTLSGQAASLLAARRLEAAHGTFALSGQDATFLKAFRLLAERGLLTLSGQDAALLKASRLAAEHGAYSIAGQDATLTRAFRLLAEHGMISVSGQTAGLLKASRLTAEHGTVTLAGQDASLLRAYVMSAAHGAISISGQSAQLRRVFRLVAEHGAVAVVGQDAGFLRAYVMVAEHGTFVLSGQAATLFKPYIPQDVRVTISEMETGEEIVVVLAADEVKFTDAAESLAFTVFEETVH